MPNSVDPLVAPREAANEVSVKFRRRLDLFLIFVGVLFIASVSILTMTYVMIYRGDLESRYAPVFTDRTHTDWRQEPDGTWTATVFMDKRRGGCVYVSDQIETVIATIPSGDIVEAPLRYVADRSPGSNRPEGWQRLDAGVNITDPLIGPGATIIGSTIHRCSNSEKFTVTRWGPSVVGENEEIPEFVKKWIAAGRIGSPQDYR